MRIQSMAGLLALSLSVSGQVYALGGCGSSRLPLDSGATARANVGEKQLVLSVVSETGKYDNFIAGDEAVTNRNGNEATITETTLVLDYGVNESVKVSLLLPYINKEQTRSEAQNYPTRIAKGIGDVAAFGRFCAVKAKNRNDPEIYLGAGVKFPTGSTDEPGGSAPDLPPAFQVGSGAYDFIPTISYRQHVGKFVLIGGGHYRIPLEENDKGYEFGRELRLSFGSQYPWQLFDHDAAAMLSLDYLNAAHDEDNDGVLPPMMRSGTRVLNTGGQFVNVTTGLSMHFNERFGAQLSVSLPAYEDWNGSPERNIGQVAPDYTVQLGLTMSL